MATEKNLYTLTYQQPNQQFLQVSYELDVHGRSFTETYLPRWRPGRYQINPFAARIRNVRAADSIGNSLSIRKKSTSSWEIEHLYDSRITVQYEFYADVLDAGSTYINDGICYINPINCLMYVKETMNQPIQLKLNIPNYFKTGTGLKALGTNLYEAKDYYELVDSPLLAASALETHTFTVNSISFYVHVHGDFPLDHTIWKADFEAYTQEQMSTMEGFPASTYHYIILSLPFRHYHGVEHHNSTVICIGPSQELSKRTSYKKLLGVCSHELFHTWNVIRMRPKELVPYDFQEENYHETGFVTEGLTTFYGDFFLARSGVFSHQEYIDELNQLLERHFRNEGRKHYSVAESSYDLWVDGYEKGIPGRKVSIYNEGALLALMLDLKIRSRWSHKRSLDDVIKALWRKWVNDGKGYSYRDYQQLAEKVYGDSLSSYFNHYVSGTQPYEEELATLLPEIGLRFYLEKAEKPEERYFGLSLSDKEENPEVIDMASGSPAAAVLSLKDILIEVNPKVFEENTCLIEIERMGQRKKVQLERTASDYFSVYQVQIADESLFTRWIGK